MEFSVHKDKSPLDTISSIREILNEIGLFLLEENWSSFGSSNYSVRLSCSSIPKVGTDGKGVSRELALASAYGEFMERLQNGILFPPFFGFMEEVVFAYPDQTYVDKDVYLKNEYSRIVSLLGEQNTLSLASSTYMKQLCCVPFFDVFSNKVVSLPYDLLRWSISSNGMCSGNTPEEAISQGIGEILERYVIQFLYSNSPYILPSIPLEDLTHLDTYCLIEDILNQNYHIIVKDLTFGGSLPVIGVLLLNEARTKCKLAVASDFVFEIALSRCLTEISQGFRFDNMESRMEEMDFSDKSDRAKEMFHTMRNGSGAIPYKLIVTTSNSLMKEYQSAFLSDSKSNRDGFLFMLDVLRKNNWDLLIRDTGFLGMPAYYVYIPKVSETWRFDGRVIDSSNFTYRCILTLDSLNQNDIANLVTQIESNLNDSTNDFLDNDEIGTLVRIFVKNQPDFLGLSFYVFLTLLYIKLGNYERAFVNFHAYMQKYSMSIDNPSYYSGVLVYLKLKSQNYSQQSIETTLVHMYGKSICDEILADFSEQNDVFAYYDLPNCGNCLVCKIQQCCLYDSWKMIVSNLNIKMQTYFPDQASLQSLFE